MREGWYASTNHLSFRVLRAVAILMVVGAHSGGGIFDVVVMHGNRENKGAFAMCHPFVSYFVACMSSYPSMNLLSYTSLVGMMDP